jgi:iron complex outermembrane receptor protein
VTRNDGPFTYTATVFSSRVLHPINVERSAGLVLTNLVEPSSNTGLELLATFRRAPWTATATYAYVRSHEVIAGIRRDVPLTPRHSAGLVGMWEREDVGRLGVELYYTGVQSLEENPYATSSRPYVVFGLLAERQFGRFRVFVNGENLTGVRQTHWNPLIRPTRAPDGRWTVDAWAPLEGRNINGGLRVRF